MQTAELEEHYKDGVCVKRLVNGIEIPLDAEVPFSHVQTFVEKRLITLEKAKEIYGSFGVS